MTRDMLVPDAPVQSWRPFLWHDHHAHQRGIAALWRTNPDSLLTNTHRRGHDTDVDMLATL